MQKHTKVYFQHFWITPWEFIPCEICWKEAVDLHHINKRSSFWKNRKHLQDRIENIIALCRKHHEDAEGKILSQEELNLIHIKNLWKTLNYK